jgi:hypothetical protein
MIEIPDRLAVFFKVFQNRAEVTTAATGDLKLDLFEHGPLSYVTGYIMSKLYQKSSNKENDCSKELQALLQSLKSTEMDNTVHCGRS